ncbi:putative lipid II flippase FtsW [Treponema pallidum]|nr:putative lipid II flippase FtsW [Treponema pallidum]
MISIEKNVHQERYSFVFILLVALMVGVGFVTLYSGSVHYAQRFFRYPGYFLVRQGVSIGIGLVCLLFFTFVRLASLRKALSPLILVAFALCVCTFFPGIGSTRNGATRWIKVFDINFQPSEFVKLVLIVFLANFFDKHREHFDTPIRSIFPPFVVSVIFVSVVFFQNDFSTAMFLLFITVVMFFIAGAPLWWFLRGIMVLAPIAVLMIVTSTNRLRRVLSFLYPDRDPLGAGYQVNAALEALMDGGLWGRGIGNGVRKIASVPEVYSDFIFVVIGEEMGFIGVCLYLMLLFAFTLTGISIALRCANRFNTFLAFGASAAIVLQSILNVAVVVRLVPATGIPLPFFSSGGSSIVVTLSLCGLIINVSGDEKIRREREETVFV